MKLEITVKDFFHVYLLRLLFLTCRSRLLPYNSQLPNDFTIDPKEQTGLQETLSPTSCLQLGKLSPLSSLGLSFPNCNTKTSNEFVAEQGLESNADPESLGLNSGATTS